MRYRPLLFVIALLGPEYGWAVAPTQDEVQLPLTSVMRREHTTYAANAAGLFVAQNKKRVWGRLDTPPEMPPGGTLAVVPPGSKRILYCSRGSGNPHRKPYVDGIYCSEDEGRTWTRLFANDDLGSVLLHPNGSLFAVTNARNVVPYPTEVHVSPDLGRSWREITGGRVGDVSRIFQDPDHPDLVCLHTSGTRGYILQAEDDTYQWKTHFEWEWYRKHPPPFFQPQYSATTTLYMLPASLSNYFDHDFGDRTRLCAFQIVPTSMTFTFKLGQPILIPVSLHFHENQDVKQHYWRQRRANGYSDMPPEPTVVKFIDQADTAALWGLRVERSGNQVVHRAALADAIYRSRDRQALHDRARAERKWESVALSAAAAYRRTLDITALHDFSQPGDYRIQIVYDNVGLATKGSGEWEGSFPGPVLTIEIR